MSKLFIKWMRLIDRIHSRHREQIIRNRSQFTSKDVDTVVKSLEFEIAYLQLMLGNLKPKAVSKSRKPFSGYAIGEVLDSKAKALGEKGGIKDGNSDKK